ncbi:MAG: hypothetical protein IJ279_04000 [Clostridia bacterium]|nr:hypothetical protein [Clostridia bacterium]
MSAILHQISYKIISIVIAFLSVFGYSGNYLKADSSQWNTNYKYVFVHGLMGWGYYDTSYKFMPYWGMFGGDLMEYLDDKGFDCYAASVAPTSSAWDRACELYAQLTGTVVDYGEAHSKKCGHDRFGEDYTGNALINEWSEKDKINLLGHSFGGATVRLFASMMETGSAEEKAATKDSELSDFFKGGKGDWIYSVTSLAAPHNGTTAYCSSEGEDEIGAYDTAAYDMYIDNAFALNKTIITYKNTYYFSIACDATVQNEDGTYSPVKSKMESLFISSSEEMGSFTGVTNGGYVIDESWQKNDGLVNTNSALAPSDAPSTEYNADNVKAGIWNIMPVYNGDHMSLQGGLLKTNDVKDLYVEHLGMINKLKKNTAVKHR